MFLAVGMSLQGVKRGARQEHYRLAGRASSCGRRRPDDAFPLNNPVTAESSRILTCFCLEARKLGRSASEAR